MKRCAYCGGENAEDATRCRECGTAEFVDPAPKASPPPVSTPKRDEWLIRFLIAAVVGATVIVLSVLVAWRGAREAHGTRREQGWTQWQLEALDQAIGHYRQTHGSLPRSIDDLLSMTNEMGLVEFIPPQRLLVDGWKRPLVLSIDGTNCVITSHGRDGKPGGIGLDYDLTTANWKPKASLATLTQFLFAMNTGGMVGYCLVGGCLAFFLSWFTIKLPDWTPAGLSRLVWKVVATIIGASIVAVIISSLHIPSGH